MNRTISDPLRDQSAETRTVTLSGRDVRDVVRLLGRLIGVPDNSSVARVREAATGCIDREMLIEQARRAVRQRHQRAGHFDSVMFGEPAWDILLLLYIEESMRTFTVSKLATAGDTRPSTGLRWINYLESQQLVFRRPSQRDARVELVELTDKARTALDSYFSETLRMGQ